VNSSRRKALFSIYNPEIYGTINKEIKPQKGDYNYVH
jgi:hypothetical protein